ncbi:ST6B1 Sulfotransferase, partial [Brachypodius atriceps]|nr:ST6B1 Sulfotransferase [Brachypodius atriceps]
MSNSREAELLHTFKGIPFTTRSSPDLLKSLDTFDAREDDLLLVSYPKSGKLFVWLLAVDLLISYPLFIHLSCTEEHTPRGRSISTFRNIQTQVIVRKKKAPNNQMIYISRNPKDTAVSMFHYYRDNPNLPTVDTWAAFFDLFLKGNVVCGSWFDHFLSWAEHEDEKNILFLFYEDMKKDLPKAVKEITLFLNLNVSDNDIQDICKKSSFSEMKNDTEKENSDPNHTVCALTSNRKLIFRKGAVGDWKNYFTPKQNIRFQEIFNEKMKFSRM